MREESQNSVGLPLVKRVVEELHSRAGNKRVNELDIPFAFVMFVDRVCSDLETKALGNHFPERVLYKLPFAKRISEYKAYEDIIVVDRKLKVDRTYPRLFFDAFISVAEEWLNRYEAKKKMLPEDEEVIGDIFRVFGEYVNNGAGE